MDKKAELLEAVKKVAESPDFKKAAQLADEQGIVLHLKRLSKKEALPRFDQKVKTHYVTKLFKKLEALRYQADAVSISADEGFGECDLLLPQVTIMLQQVSHLHSWLISFYNRLRDELVEVDDQYKVLKKVPEYKENEKALTEKWLQAMDDLKEGL